MRIRIACAAALWLAAAPAFAQSPEVTGPRTLTGHMVTCTDLPVATKPIPRLVVFAPFDSEQRFATTRGTLVIKRQPDTIFDYAFEDFEVQGYDPHPAIKAPVAV